MSFYNVHLVSCVRVGYTHTHTHTRTVCTHTHRASVCARENVSYTLFIHTLYIVCVYTHHSCTHSWTKPIGHRHWVPTIWKCAGLVRVLV